MPNFPILPEIFLSVALVKVSNGLARLHLRAIASDSVASMSSVKQENETVELELSTWLVHSSLKEEPRTRLGKQSLIFCSRSTCQPICFPTSPPANFIQRCFSSLCFSPMCAEIPNLDDLNWCKKQRQRVSKHACTLRPSDCHGVIEYSCMRSLFPWEN